jgi:hypothetical protein
MMENKELTESERLEYRLSHPCFPQPSSTELPVWRYIDLAKLVALLKGQSLYLTRLDQFLDPYEGTTTLRTAEGIGLFLSRLGSKESVTTLLKFYEEARKSTFVSCWHANKHESEAMWRLYAGNVGGVAIQSTYGALTEAIRNHRNYYIGLVKYIDYSKEWFPDANSFHPVMHKRASFAHEQEVRIVHYLHESPREKNPVGISLPADINALCKAIYVSPSAPKYYFEAVKTILDAIEPSLSDRLTWSQMVAPPVRADTYQLES